MRLVTSNRPLRELVAEAKAEVMEEIEDDREEGEEDKPVDLTVVPNLHPFHFLSITVCLSKVITPRKEKKTKQLSYS